MSDNEYISEQEILRRRDMRDRLTFTIDPADAKDFDDALSYKELDNDLTEIGVHIADVTHFVALGSDVDTMAYEKGTSVYLVDQTIPMLPEKLCNELCSLRPNEDKLTMSVVFTIDANAHVVKHKVCRTVTRSDARLNYEQAQDILDGKSSDVPQDVQDSIRKIHLLAQQLRSYRFAHGAQDFEHEEVKVLIDDLGHPIGFKIEKSTPAHQLIEELMLLANRTIAEDIGKMGKPMVYRVHDKPDTDKLEAIEKFVNRSRAHVPQTLIDLLRIRAMAKAIYSTKNIGHYGLAFEYYTHFTSPIRRYPDMMVHRLVAKYILAGKDLTTVAPEDLEKACEHCSDCELLAQQMERDSIKQKQAEWLIQHIGEEFEGTISGVQDFGVFIELDETHCEGLLHVRNLGDDFWDYQEENYCLVNSRTRERLQLGDRMRVRVIGADPVRGRIDFERAAVR